MYSNVIILLRTYIICTGDIHLLSTRKASQTCCENVYLQNILYILSTHPVTLQCLFTAE